MSKKSGIFFLLKSKMQRKYSKNFNKEPRWRYTNRVWAFGAFSIIDLIEKFVQKLKGKIT